MKGTGIIFHGIGEPIPGLDPGEAAMRVSLDKFRLTLDAILESGRKDEIRLSFDDSNISDYETALPLLKEAGMTADFFVLAGRIGQPGSLGENQIRELSAEGMTIGSHGVDHVDWSKIDATTLDYELRHSRDRLGEITGIEVTEAGIPFGNYSRSVLRAIRKTGYKCAWSSDCGPMNTNAFLRPRTSIYRDSTEYDIRFIVAGTEIPPIRRARRIGGILWKTYIRP